MSLRSLFRISCSKNVLFHTIKVPKISSVYNNPVTCGFSTIEHCIPERFLVPCTPCQCFLPSRTYAKGRDKKKDTKGKKHVAINETELAEIIPLEKMKDQMQKALDTLRDEYVKNVSLRSTSGTIESLKVRVDGKDLTLQEVAQISRKNPKTIVINMTAFPTAIPATLTAIRQSGMNLNPQQDGTTLFIPVPVVTREHRENLAKNAKSLQVKCRDSIKDVQNKNIKALKRQTLAEDTVFSASEQITELAHRYVAQAEQMLQAKALELLGTDKS